MIRKLALAAALALCGSTAQADQAFNVAIDGHCNTFSLNITGQLVAGIRGGCGGPAIVGGTVARVAHKRGVIVSETAEGMVVTWYFTTPERGTGRVFVFGSDGSNSSELGAGTYSIVHGTIKAGEKRSGTDITRQFH